MGYGRDVSKGKMAVVVVAIIAVVAADAVIFNGLEEFDGINDGIFGLSTTDTVMEVGEEKVIAPLSYRHLDSVSYTAKGDTDIISMIVSDGICTVKAKSVGFVLVEATSGWNSATCQIRIVEHREDTGMRMYDMSSDDRDYVTLSDEGFKNGELSFAFNSTGNAFIGLASYTSDRLNGGRTGSYTADYSKVVMTVYKDDTAVSSNTYTMGTEGTYVGVWVPLLVHSYGEYKVKAELYTSPIASDTITGTFTYAKGNGEMDADETFHREYAWKYGGQEYSISVDIPYYEYLLYHYNNLANVYHTGDSMYSRNPYDLGAEYITTMCRENPVTDAVWAELQRNCTANHITEKAEIAKFILAFVQISYSYVSDEMQYRYPSATQTDYWAFAAETVWSGEGDCEDTSALCTALFKAAGLDAGIFMLPSHAMAGVALDDYMSTAKTDAGSTSDVLYCEIDGKTYYCCETTTGQYRPLGTVSKDITGDATFYIAEN